MNDKFRLIFESAPDAIVIVNTEGKIQLVNQQTEKLFGYTREELIGKGIELLMPSRFQNKHQAHIKGFAEKPKVRAMGTAGAALFAQHKDGKEFPVEISLSPLETAEGTLISASIRDVTKQKKTEEILREEKHNFQVFTKDTLLPIYFLNIDTKKIIYANQAFLHLLGYTPQEVAALTIYDFVNRRKDELDAIFDKVKQEKQVHVGEREWICKDGRLVNVLVSVSFVNHNGKDIFYASGQNITEQKKAEKEILQKNEKLQNLTAHLQHIREEERTHIAREIHDELGQQLTAVKMNIDWVLHKHINADEKVLAKLQDTMGMMDNLVKTVRRISSDLRPAIIDDMGLLATLEWKCLDFEERTGIPCKFISSIKEKKFENNFSINVYRILQETLTNISRHAEAKSVMVSVSENEIELCIKITDDGKGISDERARNGKTLGIIGMKERAASLGGKLTIEGAKNKGTHTQLILPLKKQDINN